MNLYMPTRFLSGQRAVIENADRIASFGQKCLIVTSKTAAKISGALDDAVEALNAMGVAYAICDTIRPNPSIDACLEAGRFGTKFGAEFVLGIGGGSPLDAAKVIAAAVSNPSITAEALYAMQWQKKPAPIVLIGTTAGTGSEVTPTAVITDRTGRKTSISGPELFAALSIGDPRYTETAPLPVTASTGMDALCHCIESFLSKTADTISRAAAAAGIRTLVPLLESVAAKNTPAFKERKALYEASILGGLAISVTGTLAPHSFGYLLSEQYDIPHGFACACFLPPLLEQAQDFAPETVRALCLQTGVSTERLLALKDAILPKYDLRMTDAQMEETSLRWFPPNKNMLKTPGEFDRSVVPKFLRSVFSEQ